METPTKYGAERNSTFSNAKKLDEIEVDKLGEEEAKIINKMLTGEETTYQDNSKKIAICELTEQSQSKQNKKNKQNELDESTQEERSQLKEIKKAHLEHIRKNLLYSYRTKSYNKQYLEKILIPNLKNDTKYHITILSLSGLKLSKLIIAHNATDLYI